jgi:hypothetical protein
MMSELNHNLFNVFIVQSSKVENTVLLSYSVKRNAIFFCFRCAKGGLESLRMESGRKWFFYKTGITQNGKTQKGKR